LKNIFFRLAFLIFIFIAFTAMKTEAQQQDSTKNECWISANFHYGFLMAQHATMQYLVKGHIPAAEIDYYKPTHGTQQWQQTFGFPEYGVAFFAANLENPTVLGNIFGIYPFINFHLNKNKKLKLYLRVGSGLAYITKKFTPFDDHKEIAIGSHINAIINLRLNTAFALGKQMRLEAGIGLTHSSNGATQTPNLGLNIPTVNLGIGYHFNPKNYFLHSDTTTSVSKKITYNILFASGINQIDPPGGPHYFAYTFSINRNRRLNQKSTLGTGLDIFYNMSNIQQMIDDSTPLKNNFQDVQVGVKISYQLALGKLTLPIEMGAYLFTKYKTDGYLYHRIGLRYQLTNHLIANLTLLTHWAKASYIEWGIGYRF